MFRKILLLMFSIILLSNLVSAADRDIVFDDVLDKNFEYEGKEFNLGLRMYEIDNAPIIAVLNGGITNDGSKTVVDGLILFKVNFRNTKKEDVHEMLLGNGNFEVKRSTLKVKSKTGTEIRTKLSFTTEKGLIKIGDYSLKCKENCKLTFEIIGDENNVGKPMINIEGTAELSRINNADFEKITLTDLKYVLFWEELHDVNEDKELDEVLKLTGVGLKKTSSFKEINIQTQKPILFTSINKGNVIVEIENPANLLNIPNTDTRFYVYENNKAKLNLWLDNKKVLTLFSGITTLNEKFRDYWNCATDSEYGCILVDESSLRVQPKTVKDVKMKTILYPNSNKGFVFDKIGLGDSSSSYISKGNQKIEFNIDSMNKIPKKLNVFSFKTDFTAQLYSDKDNLYHEYKCLWKEKKCFYDDKEVSTGFTDLRLCESDDDCLEGEFCSQDPKCEKEEKELCSYKRCLKEAVCEVTRNSRGNILFIADSYPLTSSGNQEFKNDVEDLLNNGLFTFEPFNTPDARIVFAPIYMQVGSLPSRFDGAPLMDLAQNYKNRCESQINKDIPYTVVISKGGKSYRAFAHVLRDILVMPISSGTLTSEDRRLFVHEFGHLFADLADEYIGPSKNFRPPYYNFPNCARDQFQAESWLKQMGLKAEDYGNFQYKGCGGDCPPIVCSSYIKPSENSIMAQHATGEFNEPSKWAIRKKLGELLPGLGGYISDSLDL
ncbi:MAG: M64 family metallopeptidase [Nanoarchaeota archaeon]|nr:M64 family metallopeptidase [Nanoarchaeota archaeon]